MAKAKHAPDSRQLEFDVLFDAMPDVGMRDQRDSMERPMVSLSKTPRLEPIVYTYGPVEIRVLPHQKFGWATIWDWDIIMYLLGQVTMAYDQGAQFDSPAISVNPHALLRAIGRGTGGVNYTRLRAAIGRLQTTVIETNVWLGRAQPSNKFHRFTLIHDFQEIDPSEDSSGGMRFVLPEWLVRAATERGVLSINPAYFGITSGYERFLYRVARKAVGYQESAEFKMETLHKRSGTPSRMSDFAKAIRAIVQADKMTDYTMTIRQNDAGQEIVVFGQRERGVVLAAPDPGSDRPSRPAGPNRKRQGRSGTKG